jgi:dephospho-CoA kinase
VIQAIPLLVEVGLAGEFDLVVVVDVDPEVAVRRLVAARGMTDVDARARIAAQAGREERLAAADVVVDNSGTPQELADQVAGLWRRLTGDAAGA